jgi:hypothetical protein
MSYFKPLNSNENNLNIIRFSLNANATILYPSINQLPSTFSINHIKNTVVINYNGIFDPSDIPSILISSNVAASVLITNKSNSNCNITSSVDYIPNVDVMITGKKLIGSTFAIANKGWKFTTNSTNDNIVYSDMLVGINTDDPSFNLTHSGTLGFVPNLVNCSTLNSTTLKNNYLNLINIDKSANLTLPIPSSVDGQMIKISIANINVANGYLNLNMTSNISATNTSNIVLQSIGDSVSLCSYNNKWIVIDQNINELIPTYNDITTSLYSNLPNPSIFLNGKLSIINIDLNANINLPDSTGYDGKYVEMVVGANSWPYYANLILSNITCKQSSLVLSNIGDHVKLFGYNSKWLLTNSNFY